MIEDRIIKRRGKQKRGIETKKQLLQTALKLFSEKGYQQVTVDEIVEKSNSSKGSFYFHFQSKHNILMEKFKEIDQFYSDFYKSIPENLPATEKILLFINNQMKYIENELGIDLMRVIYSNAIMTEESNYFTNQERPLFKILKQFIIEGQEKNEIITTIPATKLNIIVTKGLLGSIYHWCMDHTNYSLQKESEHFFISLINGITINSPQKK